MTLFDSEPEEGEEKPQKKSPLTSGPITFELSPEEPVGSFGVSYAFLDSDGNVLHPDVRSKQDGCTVRGNMIDQDWFQSGSENDRNLLVQIASAELPERS